MGEMVSRAKKKGKILAQEIGDEDLLSRLSDELIHKVLSFVDAKVAVQTSALSRRWKFIWTTLPFLNFGWYGNSTHKNISEFIRHVLSNRDHDSHLSELKFCVHNNVVIKDLVDKFVEYAISHNVQSLTLDLLDDHKPYKLSTFSSKSLEKLIFLPAITTLHLSKCVSPMTTVWNFPAVTIPDSGLWRRHEVNSEFVCLLDRIMQKYPETFEHFTTKNKKLCSMYLNILCTSLNDFIKISITDFDCEMIVAYRDVFSYLQNQGLDVSWVVNRLNYIEHIWFSKALVNELHSIDCHIEDAKTKLQELQAQVNNVKIKLQDLETRVDDAKSKLQDLQTLRTEKLTEIEKAFGTMGTNIVVGFIGDDLLPNT
ncbi:FBD-associated F-box protein At5g44490-like [Apium graveolens]|uniref:FBD-associated F-box protein At5g44490-like n=1 Tax=Apium graveolens TaxID=4045 RepID=UPI003D7A9778